MKRVSAIWVIEPSYWNIQTLPQSWLVRLSKSQPRSSDVKNRIRLKISWRRNIDLIFRSGAIMEITERPPTMLEWFWYSNVLNVVAGHSWGLHMLLTSYLIVEDWDSGGPSREQHETPLHRDYVRPTGTHKGMSSNNFMAWLNGFLLRGYLFCRIPDEPGLTSKVKLPPVA